jgi:hypothetical protein
MLVLASAISIWRGLVSGLSEYLSNKGEVFHQFNFKWTPPIPLASRFSIVTSIYNILSTSMWLTSWKTGMDSPGFRNVNGHLSNMNAGKR